MKKLFFIGILMSYSFLSFSQITDENGVSATGDLNQELSGNIGIGTSTPTTALDINDGTLTVRRDNSYGFLAQFGGSTTNGNYRNINFAKDINNDLTFSMLDSDGSQRVWITAMQDRGWISLKDSNGSEIFKVAKNESDIYGSYLHMPKTNSRIVIGSYGGYLFEDGYKLVVKDGSAMIEGDIITNSNIGIGTTTPTEELEVVGTIKANHGYFNNTVANGATFIDVNDRRSKTLLLSAGTDSANQPLFEFFDFPQSNLNSVPTIQFNLEDRGDAKRFGFVAEQGGATALRIYNKSQEEIYKLYENNDFVLFNLPKPDSHLSIGTTSYIDNGETYKLTVAGKIRAHAIKVYTDWADFVFEEDYNLPSLDEVENYIKINGHLNDVPSAKEVEKNGIELGEMNKILLQKIEELTLYTIQLKKEIDELKNKMD